jgi:hypothetical protein
MLNQVGNLTPEERPALQDAFWLEADTITDRSPSGGCSAPIKAWSCERGRRPSGSRNEARDQSRDASGLPRPTTFSLVVGDHFEQLRRR